MARSGPSVAVQKLNRAVEDAAEIVRDKVMNKRMEVLVVSSTAICLYGYDQGMMSLVNTNYDYLATMGIGGRDPLVGVIVSVHYLGCATGAVIGSRLADEWGRKPAIAACMITTCVGNLAMFLSGLGPLGAARTTMLLGRIVMGLGVGGFDSVIPVYSAELSDEDSRGRALAQEFQGNILGLNLAFMLNVLVTRALGKSNQWAWRIPIVAMQVFPAILAALIYSLPESPRWHLSKGRDEQAKEVLEDIYSPEDASQTFQKLENARDEEQSSPVTYTDMIVPGRPQFHSTIITIMGQINQALTGYGCISVYGPQIFELLGFDYRSAEHLTMANYGSYFAFMTFAWLLIDTVGRRALLLWGSAVLTTCFLLLALFGGLIVSSARVANEPLAIAGTFALFLATIAFGVGWLVPAWLQPTEIYPSPARAKGAAISVVVWGFANFAVTFVSPVLFNNLTYWIFLIFAASNAIAGLWTWLYTPETGGRTFEENAQFFVDARDQKSWFVHKVDSGRFKKMPPQEKAGSGILSYIVPRSSSARAGETSPLLRDQADR